MKNTRIADLALMAVTALWGLTFVFVKQSLEETSVEGFLFFRFLLAFSCLLGYLIVRGKKVPRSTLGAGVALGLLLHLSYFFQTFGLDLTTATNAGFITGFNVVLVPILSTLLLRKPPTIQTSLGVVLATCGLMVMAGYSISEWNRGDIMVLACSLTIALHTLMTGHFAPRHNIIPLTTVQMGTIAALSGIHTAAAGSFPRNLSLYVWAVILFTALFASVAAFIIQTAAQRITTPTRAALTFTLEPVFAAVGAWLVIGEAPSPQTYFGGVLILAGMLISQIKPKRWSDVPARLKIDR